MTQGYLTDPATRQIHVCKQYTPFPVADAHFETGFELPKPSSSMHHYCIMSVPLHNLPQMAIWWPNEHPPTTVSHPQRAPRCAPECGDQLNV